MALESLTITAICVWQIFSGTTAAPAVKIISAGHLSDFDHNRVRVEYVIHPRESQKKLEKSHVQQLEYSRNLTGPWRNAKIKEQKDNLLFWDTTDIPTGHYFIRQRALGKKAFGGYAWFEVEVSHPRPGTHLRHEE